MKFSSDVLFLRATKYDFKSKEGEQIIAYSAQVLSDGVVFKCKLAAPVYEALREMVQVKGIASFELRAFKEVPSLYLLAFEAE